MLSDDMGECRAFDGKVGRFAGFLGDSRQQKRHGKEYYKYRLHQTATATPNETRLSDRMKLRIYTISRTCLPARSPSSAAVSHIC